MVKIKITDRTEMMMAQAVNLAQNGMMKSVIHAKGKDLFITNMDDTIILHFGMNQDFPQPVSFFANDYESNEINIENGQLAFISNTGGYSRTKTCPSPKSNFNDAEGIWKRFSTVDKSIQINFNKNILSLLDDDLSHVEIHNQNGVKIVQKNIYSGARVEIEDKVVKGGLLGNDMPNFEVIGIRTTDFKAIFSFVEDLTLYIQPGHNWVYFSDPNNIIEGVLATCLYDEIPYIAQVK